MTILNCTKLKFESCYIQVHYYNYLIEWTWIVQHNVLFFSKFWQNENNLIYFEGARILQYFNIMMHWDKQLVLYLKFNIFKVLKFWACNYVNLKLQGYFFVLWILKFIFIFLKQTNRLLYFVVISSPKCKNMINFFCFHIYFIAIRVKCYYWWWPL
jgi:hypothetical protein